VDNPLALIGYDDPDTLQLATALGARFIQAPAGDDQAWTDWREHLLADAGATKIVVALFHDLSPSKPVAEMGLDRWHNQAEKPLMHWIVALGGAALLCHDGGSIVAVTDDPTPLDSSGFAAEAAVGEGVAALVRSLALSEGKRGVRTNGVLTPSRLIKLPPVAPMPPLAGFPGTLAEDVLSSVRLLLSADAAYLTGHCLPADRGRSW
jgi:NAD(P)-dependent dehydrogenase (short-subunit alcohol dehydrogenase family)